MAHATIGRFDRTIKKHMQNFFRTLSEKDQRRYAAIEAQRADRKVGEPVGGKPN